MGIFADIAVVRVSLESVASRDYVGEESGENRESASENIRVSLLVPTVFARMSTTQQPSREREDGDAEEAPRERTSLFDSNMNETQRRSRFLSLLSLLCLVAIVLVLVSPAAEEEEYSTSHFKDSVANQIDSLGSTLTHYAGYRTVHRTAQPVDYRTVDEGDLTTDALQFNGAALSSWSESTLYVQRTDALYQSRPSSFGPHLTEQDMTGLLFPITAFAKNSDSYACSPVPTTPSPSPLIVQRSVIASNRTVPANWIALVQRGHCAFSDKVRFAQYHGASAVLFGDQAYEEGGIGGFGGLLTPWSPGSSSLSSKFLIRWLTRLREQTRLPIFIFPLRSSRERRICRSSRPTPMNNDCRLPPRTPTSRPCRTSRSDRARIQ